LFEDTCPFFFSLHVFVCPPPPYFFLPPPFSFPPLLFCSAANHAKPYFILVFSLLTFPKLYRFPLLFRSTTPFFPLVKKPFTCHTSRCPKTPPVSALAPLPFGPLCNGSVWNIGPQPWRPVSCFFPGVPFLGLDNQSRFHYPLTIFCSHVPPYHTLYLQPPPGVFLSFSSPLYSGFPEELLLFSTSLVTCSLLKCFPVLPSSFRL